ncbi:MAG TPA: hypothetical protein VK613_14980 [Gaiellaceae bacterium]|nr:hypothetical protein [Gaiellaceae bacterium]
MKRLIPLLVVFAAGLAASFALASPNPGHGPTTSTSTSTNHGKSAGSKAKCRPLNLKGTVPAGSIALTVTKAAGPNAKQLLNTTANLTVPAGKVSVQAWSCATTGATGLQTLVLRQLRIGGSPHPATTTTTSSP